MYLQKVKSKKHFFFGILKATDDKSRIRIRIRKSLERIWRLRIRIRTNMSRIHNIVRNKMNHNDPKRMYPDLFYWDGYRFAPNYYELLFGVYLWSSFVLSYFVSNNGMITGGWFFWIFLLFFIQHCRPSDSTVSEDEPRTVAILALAVRRSNHLARSYPLVILNDHPNLSGMLRYCINQCCGSALASMRIRIQFFFFI